LSLVCAPTDERYAHCFVVFSVIVIISATMLIQSLREYAQEEKTRPTPESNVDIEPGDKRVTLVTCTNLAMPGIN
jgi:hypothetical protein